MSSSECLSVISKFWICGSLGVVVGQSKTRTNFLSSAVCVHSLLVGWHIIVYGISPAAWPRLHWFSSSVCNDQICSFWGKGVFKILPLCAACLSIGESYMGVDRANIEYYCAETWEGVLYFSYTRQLPDDALSLFSSGIASQPPRSFDDCVVEVRGKK